MKKVLFTLLITFLLVNYSSSCFRPAPKPTCPRNSNKYRLTFQYACRSGVCLQSCKGKVMWNGQIIQSISPKNRCVQSYSTWVYVRRGTNRLRFQGLGKSDRKGLTIDNVRLVRYGSKRNIVVNGGFQKPCVGKGWKIFNNIPGWKGRGIEIGNGKIYNKSWNSQVCELDGHRNYAITQSWRFNRHFKLIKKGGSQCGKNKLRLRDIQSLINLLRRLKKQNPCKLPK